MGVAYLWKGLTAYEATGAKALRPFYYALLAEAERWAGRPDEALDAVNRGLAAATDTDRFYEPELHRLRGELLFAVASGRQLEAEASLRLAMTSAQAQGAALLEERAEQSLHRAGMVPTSPMR